MEYTYSERIDFARLDDILDPDLTNSGTLKENSVHSARPDLNTQTHQATTYSQPRQEPISPLWEDHSIPDPFHTTDAFTDFQSSGSEQQSVGFDGLACLFSDDNFFMERVDPILDLGGQTLERSSPEHLSLLGTSGARLNNETLDSLRGATSVQTAQAPVSHPVSADSSSAPRYSRRYSTEQIAMLQTWISNKSHNPYPDKDDITFLTKLTGLAERQIRSWIAKHRQRKLTSPQLPGCTHIDTGCTLAKTTNSSLNVAPKSTIVSSAGSDNKRCGSWKSGSDRSRGITSGCTLTDYSNGSASTLHWWMGLLPEHNQDFLEVEDVPILYPSTSQNPEDVPYMLEKLYRYASKPDKTVGSRTPTLKPSSTMSFSMGYRSREMLFPCYVCRLRKIECDKCRPHCGQCVAHGFSCEYTKPSRTAKKAPGLTKGTTAVGINAYDSQLTHNRHNEDRSDLASMPSEYSAEAGASDRSDASFFSAQSSVSVYSAHSYTSYGARRGRRRWAAPLISQPAKRRIASSSPENPARTTIGHKHRTCKYCGKVFERFYTCKRHEQTIHAHDVVWICNPISNANTDTNYHAATAATTPYETKPINPQTQSCPFCQQLPIPHCPHRMQECWVQPEDQRTFFRRDNFKQHLLGKHKVSPPTINTIDLTQWEVKVSSSINEGKTIWKRRRIDDSSEDLKP